MFPWHYWQCSLHHKGQVFLTHRWYDTDNFTSSASHLDSQRCPGPRIWVHLSWKSGEFDQTEHKHIKLQYYVRVCMKRWSSAGFLCARAQSGGDVNGTVLKQRAGLQQKDIQQHILTAKEVPHQRGSPSSELHDSCSIRGLSLVS